ncbi:MAG: FtsQ-type POTRA domain-containing protein [Pseudomonadota bacterium]
MAKLTATTLLLVLLLVAGFVYLQLDQPVTRVNVTGQLLPEEREAIEAAVLEHLDGGILSADLDALQAGILGLAWPRAVAIRRAWPGTLNLEVEKPAVVARWQDAYLASDGRVVHLPVGASDLPRLDCEIAEPRDAMEMFHRLSEAAEAAGLFIEHLGENAFGEWEVLVSNGAVEALPIRLGAESVDERLDRFLLVFQEHLSTRVTDIAAVDARYHNGIAVRWRESDASLLAAADDEAAESIQSTNMTEQRTEMTYGL